MLPGAPITVWRYLSVWLWRLVGLTLAIIVTVLSFAAAVKFLADGRLSPLDTLRFMFYAMPPMLQYALPFAGGFAATLTYHRFAADNEAIACRAGGVSYRALLVPALAAGLLLSGGLLALSNRVIPDFLKRMEAMITEDATRLMISTMRRGEAFAWKDDNGERLVFADEVHALGPRADAYQVLLLRGVMIVQLDKQDAIKLEGSAREAYAWFSRDAIAEPGGGERPVTRVTLVPSDLVGRGEGLGQGVVSKPRFTIYVPNVIDSDPKFFGWRELRELRDHPERMPQVETRRRRLATLLAEREAVAHIRSSLAAEGRARLVDNLGRPVVVRAAGIEWVPAEERYRFVPPAPTARDPDPAVVMEFHDGARLLRYFSRRITIHSDWQPDSAHDPLSFDITIKDFRSEGPTGVAVEHSATTMRGFKPAYDTLDALMRESSFDLLDRADRHLAANPYDEHLRPFRDDLRRRIADLMLEIFSKTNERVAMAIACLVMVLTGGVMALRLRDSLPLVVYLWSFFPALASVLTIVGGQQMVHDHGLIGLPVLWGGVGGLAVFTAAEYTRLRRY